MGRGFASTKIWSKTWKLAIRLSTPVKKMAGVSSGTMIRRTCAPRPAPSTLAASIRSSGIPWSAARKMITLIPRPCQIDIAMIEGIASVGSLSHFCDGIPKTPRTWLRRPDSGL